MELKVLTVLKSHILKMYLFVAITENNPQNKFHRDYLWFMYCSFMLCCFILLLMAACTKSWIFSLYCCTNAFAASCCSAWLVHAERLVSFACLLCYRLWHFVSLCLYLLACHFPHWLDCGWRSAGWLTPAHLQKCLINDYKQEERK